MSIYPVPTEFLHLQMKTELRLDGEIDCVVARRGQRHHEELKRYFINPKSEGAYLVADRYAEYIASFAAEVEYHARFLTSLAKIKNPFCRKNFTILPFGLI